MRVCGPPPARQTRGAAVPIARPRRRCARAVFVTPAGGVHAAVTLAGGAWRLDSRGRVGGRLKAALGRDALTAVPPTPRSDRSRPRRDVLGRRRTTRRASRSAAPTCCSARAMTARRHDRRARPGLRPRSASTARRHRAAAARPPAPMIVRRDLRARRPRLQRQHLAPRRVRERDRLRHGAGRDLLVHQLPHRRRVRPGRRGYIDDVLKPDIVVHSNSFLFGPFDGTGWFARSVDAAAAAGVLWVNSAGNYRDRHWEGAWSDANGDGHSTSRGRRRLPLVLHHGPHARLRHLLERAASAADRRERLPARALPGCGRRQVRRSTRRPGSRSSRRASSPAPDPHADCRRAAAGRRHLLPRA